MRATAPMALLSRTSLALLIPICLPVPAASALGTNFISTSDDRVECGPEDSPATPGDPKFPAGADACQALVDSYSKLPGYWRTYDWNDNEANEWVTVTEQYGAPGKRDCLFDVKHVDEESTADVRIGNNDIEDFVKIALKKALNGEVPAQTGFFTCNDARDESQRVKLQWEVYDDTPKDGDGDGDGGDDDGGGDDGGGPGSSATTLKISSLLNRDCGWPVGLGAMFGLVTAMGLWVFY
ncbi:hypothetical protein F4778DRAFT_795184 [Xylariomycetidae sp. FL2044]|nr:hypothetical protein F4778DRAFT_795184 [Xylariomycetidae sp. FL2044]